MSHPPKAGHTRVTIDLARGQTVPQALGFGATSSKADAYLRDLQSAVRDLDLPKLPKDGAELRAWLLAEVINNASLNAISKPEDGAEFWRSGLRDAALELTKAHLNVVTPKGFVDAVYQCGLLDGEAKKTASLGLAAQEATGCADAITKPEDPEAFVVWLIGYGEGQVQPEVAACEAEAFERGRVAGLRAAVWIQENDGIFAVRAPGMLTFDGSDTRRGWTKEGPTWCYPSKETAQAAADAAPNWWEAGQ